MSHRFTIGVEEEFQIVDPASGELRSHVSELMEASSPGLGEQVKREMHQSIIEIGTKICADVHELETDMRRMRGELGAPPKAAACRSRPLERIRFPPGSIR
jgi:carboxylate-amine ligase